MIDVLETTRLRLHRWQGRHRDAFARMHADPEVMADLGGPIDRDASDAKLDRYEAAERAFGMSRWAVEDLSGRFLGYAGIMRRPDGAHPLGDHTEIGWRFHREAWGHGYATESAKAALNHARCLLGLTDIIAYTSRENLRSQSVMTRLGMVRNAARDFTVKGPQGQPFSALVWQIAPASTSD